MKVGAAGEADLEFPGQVKLQRKRKQVRAYKLCRGNNIVRKRIEFAAGIDRDVSYRIAACAVGIDSRLAEFVKEALQILRGDIMQLDILPGRQVKGGLRGKVHGCLGNLPPA